MTMFSKPPEVGQPAAAPNPVDILDALHAGTLAAHAFDHRAHVFAAWWAMREHGVDGGGARFRSALQAYCQHLGAADKYHVTITEALLYLIAMELAGEGDAGGHWQTAWYRFERRACYLLETSRSALAPYYSSALLAREDARATFVPPDRKPLPRHETLVPAVG